MRALVTGGGGFIGSRMCRHLMAAGWQVAGLVRPGGQARLPAGVTPFEATDDLGALTYFLRKFQPEAVFHFAALYVTEHQPGDVDRLVRDNIIFGVRLLEALARSGGSRIFLTAGSSWQNSRFDRLDSAPANLYAASKQAFEELLRYYAEEEGFSAITLRLFDTYGENDERPKLLNALVKALKTGTRIELTPGEQEVDLVHVSDVCRAFVRGHELLREEPGGLRVYGLSSGRRMTVRGLVELLERITGRKLEAVWGGRPYRRREVMRLQTGYPEMPGWRPAIELETGLLNVYRQQGEEALL
jgi:nucleoside-diphosphate-sugar epimerase